MQRTQLDSYLRKMPSFCAKRWLREIIIFHLIIPHCGSPLTCQLCAFHAGNVFTLLILAVMLQVAFLREFVRPPLGVCFKLIWPFQGVHAVCASVSVVWVEGVVFKCCHVCKMKKRNIVAKLTRYWADLRVDYFQAKHKVRMTLIWLAGFSFNTCISH